MITILSKLLNIPPLCLMPIYTQLLIIRYEYKKPPNYKILCTSLKFQNLIMMISFDLI